MNKANFISSDNLEVFLWHIEDDKRAFPLFNLGGAKKLEDIEELITHSKY
jgi:hypothetical protein